MTHEQRTIHVTAYRDADGHPTCCADWNSARCIFVQTRKLGLVEVCLDWLPPRSFDTGVMDVLGGWWRCHDCEKWFAPTQRCDYDWSGSCALGDFNTIRDRGVPPTLGNEMAKLESSLDSWGWVLKLGKIKWRWWL